MVVDALSTHSTELRARVASHTCTITTPPAGRSWKITSSYSRFHNGHEPWMHESGLGVGPAAPEDSAPTSAPSPYAGPVHRISWRGSITSSPLAGDWNPGPGHRPLASTDPTNPLSRQHRQPLLFRRDTDTDEPANFAPQPPPPDDISAARVKGLATAPSPPWRISGFRASRSPSTLPSTCSGVSTRWASGPSTAFPATTTSSPSTTCRRAG